MEFGYTFAGLVVGFIVGLSGVGAGALMTPILILFFGIPPALAVGTDLLYAAATKSAGSWVHWRHGNIAWTVVRRLAAGSIPAALLTALAAYLLGAQSKHFSSLVTTGLGCMVVLTALSLIFKGRLRFLKFGTGSANWSERKRAVVTTATGAVLGVLVTLTSVGAGALGMVALLALYPRLPPVLLVGSDIAHAVPLTLVAGLGHAALGNVNYMMLASLLAGSLPGVYLGSHAASRVPELVLRLVLAAVLLLAGGKLIAA
jgi:uncharacterized protein